MSSIIEIEVKKNLLISDSSKDVILISTNPIPATTTSQLINDSDFIKSTEAIITSIIFG